MQQHELSLTISTSNTTEKYFRDFKVVRIKNVTDRIDYGYTASADFSISEPCLLRITDIQAEGVDWRNVPGCQINSQDTKEKALFDGDIVIARTGATTGKSFLIKKPPVAVFASYLIRLKPSTDIFPEYLYYFTLSQYYWRQIRANSRGAAQEGVNATLLSSIELPLPPLEEQKRIARVLAKCDRIRRTRRYTQQLSDTYLQSVFLEMFGDPVTNPKQWSIKKLESQINNIESGWSPVCSEAPRSNLDHWAVLKLGAVTGGIFKPDENKLFPDTLDPRPELAVHKGDLLVTRKNTLGLVAACALVRHEYPQLMIPDTIFRFIIRKESEVVNEYLWGLFNNNFFRKSVQSLATGTAGSMPNISKAKFLNILIPIPPPKLQEQFAKAIDKYDRIRTQQCEATRQTEHLFQTILHRAFRGDL